MSKVGAEHKPRLGCNTTSFQKKSRSKLVSIPGTRPSVQNGQLIVSTGVTSLDYVIGGGLAVGTLLLIEEDKYDSYSRMLLKYFLAEGVVCGHNLFIASARDHPEDILQELPAPILDDIASTRVEEGQTKLGDPEGQDSMKIAWRYQNLPKVQTALASSSRFGHYYDVSKTMDAEMRQTTKCNSFFLPDELPINSATEPSQMNEGYMALLRSIQGVIRREGFDGATPQNKSRNILRIGLHSLGSALWGDDICCKENPSNASSLTTFLYGLRALLRSSLSVGVVTVPSHLIQNRAIMGRVTKLCDTAIALESFKGLEGETNPLYKDYHGLLHVKQIPHLNCLVCEVPDTKDLAFKLKRKQFTIETCQTQ
ncbi:elongator complex protein 4 [Megalops cyprinoides]|uniref:elongator complex protein 4 n=1 Tax=Megalops cyprinoides TaxID=118141 RepID=UPI0018644782|nr:elongator complex protein 4 [Megalops cyprinoides]